MCSEPSYQLHYADGILSELLIADHTDNRDLSWVSDKCEEFLAVLGRHSPLFISNLEKLTTVLK